ncbi:MAG: hypothetical protein ABWW65_01700, partial [Thermoprotei archaeon]
MTSVSEYWFLDYYRVLVISENTHKVISVDVYRRKWIFEDYEEVCSHDNKYCLLYKIIKVPDNYKL